MDSDINVDVAIGSAVKKAITGDPLNCNIKYKQPFSFKPTATWIGSINGLPKTKDKSYGFFRRWIPISFPHTFKKDPKFEMKMKKACLSDEGKSGIVNTCLSLYRCAWADGYFKVPDSSEALKKRLEEASDSVAAWIAECVEFDADTELPRTEVFDANSKWCDDNEIKDKESRSDLYSKLRRHGCDTELRNRIEGRQVRAVKGLTIGKV